MQSPGNAPTAEQTRWRETVRRVGCIVTGSTATEPTEPGDIQIHHVVGAAGVRNKVHIGHWYILPLHHRLHDVNSDFPVNITTNKSRFVQQYSSEKNLFMTMLYGFLMTGIELPFDMAVLNAIASIGGEG